jgi:hypothetical protein
MLIFLSIFRMLPGLNFAVIELYLPKCGRLSTTCQRGCTAPSTFGRHSFQTQQSLFRIFAMDFTVLSVLVFIYTGKRKEKLPLLFT